MLYKEESLCLFECLSNIIRYKIHGDVEMSGLTLLHKIAKEIIYAMKAKATL